MKWGYPRRDQEVRESRARLAREIALKYEAFRAIAARVIRRFGKGGSGR